jgi:hypothetical protein
MYIPRNWEFGSALAKLQNFRGGWVDTPKPISVRHCLPVQEDKLCWVYLAIDNLDFFHKH